MGEVLYRKYRSKSLDEIVGQQHITSTLQNALKTGRISHAYLFTGPHGVGKTSVARILAHNINDLPYEDDSQHLDIIEIDAASNRRIDEIRELRDKVHVAPTSAKYKVYIIDEVHMLTKEAFNALLKTLEEPPAHVVFILATTEVHKLPETIISRTQRYTFRPITEQSAIDHLRQMATSEKIKVDDEALELIAEHGNGSFRDSISLLDQMSHTTDTISAETVRQTLGVPPKSAVDTLLHQLLAGDVPIMVTELTQLYDRGYQAGPIASQLSKLLRSRALNQQSSASELELLHKLMNVPAAHEPTMYLELILIEAAMEINPAQPAPAETVVQRPQPTPPKTEEQPAITKQEAPKGETPKPEPKPKKDPVKPKAQKVNESSVETLWPQVLEELKGRHNTLYGVARMAKPSIRGDELVLSFGFGFHQRRCNEPRNREKISAIIHEITGQPISIVCEVQKGAEPPKETKPTETQTNKPKSDTLESITEVFGGGEVLD